MSYAIMGGRGGLTFLLTYSSSRPLRVLYVDGMSAAITETGTFDSQDILIHGKVNQGGDRWGPGAPRGPGGEYQRALGLCEWGKQFGVEGFVRMNSGL